MRLIRSLMSHNRARSASALRPSAVCDYLYLWAAVGKRCDRKSTPALSNGHNMQDGSGERLMPRPRCTRQPTRFDNLVINAFRGESCEIRIEHYFARLVPSQSRAEITPVKNARRSEPEGDHPDLDAFDPHPERSDWGQQEYENWYEYLDEMAAEATPADWWEDQLEYSEQPERMKALVEELVAAGCRRADLLEALMRLKYRYDDSPTRSATFLKQSKLFEYVADLYPLTFGRHFTSEDWKVMHGLIKRCAEHLRQEAERFKRAPHARRREAVTELLDLVQRDTGRPRHRLVLELLYIFVDPTLTATRLRKIASRALLPKRRAARPKLPVRRKSKTARKVRLSGYVIGKRIKQAKARAGLDQWDDEDD